MSKIMIVALLITALMTITACSGIRSKNSSEGQPNSGSANGTSSIVDTAAFNTVGYDYEPGDFKYQFELTNEQQGEFSALLQAENWKHAAPEDLPEYGLTCVLAAKSAESFLYVFPWDENTTIIKIVPANAKGDGSDSDYYLSPFEVGEDSRSFMESFKALSQIRGFQ